jgi:hypothetical protein
LVTLIVTFIAHAVVKVAPAGVGGDSGNEVVLRRVEAVVVVLVEDDGFRGVAREFAGFLNNLDDAFRVMNAVAVNENEIRSGDNFVGRNGVALE